MAQVATIAPGIEISYLDSGVPSVNPDHYTTVLVIHGYTWSGGWFHSLFLRKSLINEIDTFKKTLPFGSPNGIRIIAINRRDYPGSTPFTEEEVAAIKSDEYTNDDLRAFMLARTTEFAKFAEYLVISGISKEVVNGKGGIAIVGWSLGQAYVTNFIEDVKKLEVGLREMVEKNVRCVVAFGERSIVI